MESGTGGHGVCVCADHYHGAFHAAGAKLNGVDWETGCYFRKPIPVKDADGLKLERLEACSG
jgi:hypothetical protein